MRDYLCSPFLLVQNKLIFDRTLQANIFHFYLAEALQ